MPFVGYGYQTPLSDKLLGGRVSWRGSSKFGLNIPIRNDLEAEASRLAGRFEPFGEITRIRGLGRGIDYVAEAIDLKVVSRLTKVLGFGTDVGIGAGFQLYEDWGNPYLTTGQKIGRATVSGLGGAGSALLTGLVFGCGSSLPCAVAAGIIGGVTWAIFGQPLVFEVVFPEFFEPVRNLEPLSTP